MFNSIDGNIFEYNYDIIAIIECFNNLIIFILELRTKCYNINTFCSIFINYYQLMKMPIYFSNASNTRNSNC